MTRREQIERALREYISLSAGAIDDALDEVWLTLGEGDEIDVVVYRPHERLQLLLAMSSPPTETRH